MKRNATIPPALANLKGTPCGMFLSNEIQMADIIDIVLEQIGPSSLYQTSFSISEEFLRRLYFIKEKGLLKHTSLLLDHKATLKTARIWNFCQNVFDEAFLTANHSKVLLFAADSGDVVSVISSQNLTRGNRMEAYSISTDPNLFSSLYEGYSKLLSNSIPLNEIFAGRFNKD